ncbi:hypothetical protein EG68_12579 [Paragonimus skrjabini miyazakii]|uniref:Uncharacterized protein n=1 Tax=Paragonimus skrjabini miyazakii TaxID=59628 RepID=A0A8S9YCQ5_9TREM|nr:hypothetical protein EG68_12579 [Paragonimus skrjabini miyazakii]
MARLNTMFTASYRDHSLNRNIVSEQCTFIY